jgi:DNA-binding transcriptional ArsR family regulator
MKGKSMKELSEGGALRRFFDPRLIKALGHPVREHLLAVLNERIASASEIGDELGAEVSSFYHHIEELERLECIERVASRRRRGASEHFFRARRTVFFDDAAWQALPNSLKDDSMVNSAQLIADDMAGSIDAKTFSARSETHVSWSPCLFDAQGWDETTDLLKDTLSRLTAIQEASAARLIGRTDGGISASVALLAFETPERKRRTSATVAEPGQRRDQASAQ